jgi:hypothetical protein
MDEGSPTNACIMRCLLLLVSWAVHAATSGRVKHARMLSPLNSLLPLLHALQVCPHVLPLLLQAAATHVAGPGSS